MAAKIGCMRNLLACPAWLFRHLSGWFLLGAACWLPLPCAAAGAITASSYFEDRAGTLVFDEIRQRNFTTFELPLQKGYTPSVHWVRLTLTPLPGSAPGDPYVLRIRPGYLDEITLYDPLAPAGQVARVGDRHPTPQAGYVSLNHNFTIPAGAVARDVWLRLKTTSTTLLYLDALPLAQAARGDINQELIAALMVGAMLPLLLVALINHRAARDGVSLLLIVNQVAGLVYCLFLFGFVRIWFDGMVSPASLDWLTSAVVIGTVTANCAFNLAFLKECKGSWRPVMPVTATFGVCCINLLLFLAGQVQVALTSNILCVLAVPGIFLLAILTPSRQPPPEAKRVFTRKQLLLMYVPIAMIGWIVALPLLGLMPSSPEMMQLVQPGYYFISVTAAVFSVVYRTRVLRRVQEVAQARLQAAEREADLQRERAQAQNRLLSMLTHEIRTPLSLLRIAIGWLDNRPEIRAKAEAAVHELNEVISGVSLMQRIENKAMVLRREHLAIANELDALVRAQPESTRIRLDLSECPPAIDSDRLLVRIVLRNLVDNALRYSPRDSQVAVRAQHEAREGRRGVRITVTNPVDDAARPDASKLFTQFYRGPGSQRRTGSGLGLFIAHSLASELGGELSFAFEAGTTIQFSLWLPL